MRPTHRLLFGVALLASVAGAFWGCQHYVFIDPPDVAVVATTKEITIDVPAQSDILFVIDNSGSMANKQAQVKTNMVTLVTQLSMTENKFRIGLTTTDNQEQMGTGNCATPQVFGTGAKLPSNLDAVHNGRCGRLIAPTGKGIFLDRDSFATPEAMAAEFGTYIDLLTTFGSPWEQSIKSAYLALDPMLSVQGAPNAGFFRDDALLVIVFVTDESDCSFDTTPNAVAPYIDATKAAGFHCYPKADQLVASADWAARIAARKGRKDLVRVGLISGAVSDPTNGTLVPSSCRIQSDGTPTNICDCFIQNANDFCQFTHAGPRSASVPVCIDPLVCCTSLANDRLFGFAAQFDSISDSICKDDYTEALLKIADLADRQCFSLDQQPLNNDPANIQFKIRRSGDTVFNVIPEIDASAAATGNGWYYDGSTTPPEVCLAGTSRRKNGDTLQVLSINQDMSQNTTGP